MAELPGLRAILLRLFGGSRAKSRPRLLLENVGHRHIPPGQHITLTELPDQLRGLLRHHLIPGRSVRDAHTHPHGFLDLLRLCCRLLRRQPARVFLHAERPFAVIIGIGPRVSLLLHLQLLIRPAIVPARDVHVQPVTLDAKRRHRVDARQRVDSRLVAGCDACALFAIQPGHVALPLHVERLLRKGIAALHGTQHVGAATAENDPCIHVVILASGVRC